MGMIHKSIHWYGALYLSAMLLQITSCELQCPCSTYLNYYCTLDVKLKIDYPAAKLQLSCQEKITRNVEWENDPYR